MTLLMSVVVSKGLRPQYRSENSSQSRAQQLKLEVKQRCQPRELGNKNQAVLPKNNGNAARPTLSDSLRCLYFSYGNVAVV